MHVTIQKVAVPCQNLFTEKMWKPAKNTVNIRKTTIVECGKVCEKGENVP